MQVVDLIHQQVSLSLRRACGAGGFPEKDSPHA
jgi:hypothetical protein